jgi:GNAT superfamily N-acetyltransferase
VIYTVRSLDPTTWEAFAELVERNNGVFGGCWCMGGYPEGLSRTDPAVNRARKQRRVHEGHARAALVFDADNRAQGWCQYGDPEELARIKHRRAYEQDPPPRPDWRINCLFVDRRHRGQGVARAALEGELDQIASLGGGRVEAISQVTTGRRAGPSDVSCSARPSSSTSSTASSAVASSASTPICSAGSSMRPGARRARCPPQARARLRCGLIAVLGRPNTRPARFP